MWRDVFFLLICRRADWLAKLRCPATGTAVEPPESSTWICLHLFVFSLDAPTFADYFAVAQVPSGFHDQDGYEGLVPGPA
jgi:hypothetical protein